MDTVNSQLTLHEYRRLVGDAKCRWCEAVLPQEVKFYDHEYGWEVVGFTNKQWLYITCEKCLYDWALWKLGIPR